MIAKTSKTNDQTNYFYPNYFSAAFNVNLKATGNIKCLCTSSITSTLLGNKITTGPLSIQVKQSVKQESRYCILIWSFFTSSYQLFLQLCYHDYDTALQKNVNVTRDKCFPNWTLTELAFKIFHDIQIHAISLHSVCNIPDISS